MVHDRVGPRSGILPYIYICVLLYATFISLSPNIALIELYYFDLDRVLTSNNNSQVQSGCDVILRVLTMVVLDQRNSDDYTIVHTDDTSLPVQVHTWVSVRALVCVWRSVRTIVCVWRSVRTIVCGLVCAPLVCVDVASVTEKKYSYIFYNKFECN